MLTILRGFGRVLAWVAAIGVILVAVWYGVAVVRSESPPEPAAFTVQVGRAHGSLEAASAESARHLEGLREEFGLPSLSVAIATRNGFWSAATGFANVGGRVPAEPETLYSVGSIAKPLTAVAMMRLVAAGELALDQEIGSHVAEFPDAAGLTPRQLASHTAGIVHAHAGRFRQEYVTKHIYTDPADTFHLFRDHGLLFEPGKAFTYSSHGYTLLSAVLAAAAGTTYLDLMQREVFKPFGMKHTIHHAHELPLDNEAQDYSGTVLGRWVPRFPSNRGFLFGGGAYLSTPTDLVLFAIGLLEDDYLPSTLRATMFEPVTLPVGAANGRANPQNYALGWRQGRLERGQGQSLVGMHHGGTVANGATSFLLLLPEQGAAIAYAANAHPRGEGNLRAELWRWLARIVTPAKERSMHHGGGASDSRVVSERNMNNRNRP